MIWFDKSFIKFCRSFINLIKLLSTKTCSSARVRAQSNHKYQWEDLFHARKRALHRQKARIHIRIRSVDLHFV